MQEFMLHIRNVADSKKSFTPQVEEQFLNACEQYIAELKKDNKLIAAQPLVREGKIIWGSRGAWKEAPIDLSAEVQVGYYHILAEDLEDAIAIARANPEFEYTETASIEVRPIKMKEETTGFVYPKK